MAFFTFVKLDAPTPVSGNSLNAHGIRVREDFKRRDSESATVLEQIDGVIEPDGTIHLVEMKWHKEPI
jgi:hypothetical protein